MAGLNIGQLSLSELFDEEFDFSEELSSAGSEQKPEKKSEKKSEKKKKPEKPVLVTLPCKVIGANFSEDIEGEGETTVEDIAKRLIELGYSEINHKSYSIVVPVEKGSVVYVVQDSSSLSSLTEDDILIDLSDGKELSFAFGQEKVTLVKEDFKDDEVEDDDDISLGMVKEKIYTLFPLYKGIPLSYDPDSNMVVFLFDKVKADVMDYPCRLRVFGEEKDLEEGPEKITKLLDEQMAEYKNSNITISLSKTGQEHTFVVFFSSYLGSKAKSSSANKKVEKKQTKYALPCKFRVCYNDVMQTLTPEMFEGKEKVVQEEIVTYFQKTMGGLFSIEKKRDTVKLYKVTEVIGEEQVEIVNIMFEPGTRGGFVNPSWQIPDDTVERFARPHLNSAQVLEMMEVEEATVFNAVVDTEIFGWRYCDMFANRTAYYVSKWYDSQFLMAAGLKKKVPKQILKGVISYFKTQLPLEAICRVIYNHVTKEYYLHIPERVEATKVSVKALSYPPLLPSEHLVMEIHSHNKMPAFWSSVDDAAELDGMGIYGVIGHLDKKEPSMCFRATKEGCQKALEMSELFED